MLLHSFYDFNYVKKQPLKILTRLLVKAKLKDGDNKIYQRWILKYDQEFGYEEFKKMLMPKQIEPQLTEEEIMEDVENILSSFRG